MYNVYLFTQTHSHLFTDRIRHHVREAIEFVTPSVLTRKQQARVDKDREQFGGNPGQDISDDEDDTESEDESDCKWCAECGSTAVIGNSTLCLSCE